MCIYKSPLDSVPFNSHTFFIWVLFRGNFCLLCVCIFFCVAHCLHTVTEENSELVRSVNAGVFGILDNILSSTHTSMEYTLLRTLAAGKTTHIYLNTVDV